MKHITLCLMTFALTVSARAATWFVATNGSDTAHNGTGGWEQAYATVSNALVKSGNGDLILVSNGTYNIAETLSVGDRAVCGWSGDPADTIIDGGNSVRCFYLTHTNALVAGFTIINGAAIEAGGVYITGGGTLSNCVISGCMATSTNSSDPNQGGGGVTIHAGGRVYDCTIAGNTSSNYGGGIIKRTGGWGEISRCVIAGNDAVRMGGGVYNYNGALNIRYCTITGNTASVYGGGAGLALQGAIEHCVFRDNLAGASGGAVYMDGAAALCRNSLLVSNTAVNTSHGGGGVYVLNRGSIENCAIVANAGGRYGGGLRFYTDNASAYGYFYNNIIYGNTVTTGSSSNWFNSGSYATNGIHYHDCTAPTGGTGWAGTGCIEGPPAFAAGDDYHLQPGSPCINSGTNLTWMADAADLDGRTRRDRFSGVVDMGCYEYIARGSLIAIH